MKTDKYSLKTRQQIKKLFDQGVKQNDIAKAVGCSRFTVYYSLKMLQEPDFFNEKYLSKTKKQQLFDHRTDLMLNNNTKPIKCLSNDKSGLNCNVINKRWNGKFKIKLGETIYSGPPSKYKEGVCDSGLNCSSHTEPSRHLNGDSVVESNGNISSATKIGQLSSINNLNKSSKIDSYSNQNVNDHPVDSLLKKFVSNKQLKDCNELDSNCHSPLSEESETLETLLEKDSRESSSGNGYPQCFETKINKDFVNNCKINSNSNNCSKKLVSIVQSDNRENIKDMVRLMQEPVKCDSHNTRKNVRAPKRFCSVDDIDVDSLHKKSLLNKTSKTSRFRRLSCRSDFSDSENSDECDQDKDVLGWKKSKNSETNDSSRHLNGDDCFSLNGLEKPYKVKKSNKASGKEEAIQSVSMNGVDSDYDKVDINLLLEISATDRKKFESKKSKIRRKTADWTLISETEQYYNEREEILRNKSKIDSDESTNEELPNRISKSIRNAQNKNLESNVYKEKKPLSERDLKLKCSNSSTRKNSLKKMPEPTNTKELRNRSFGDRSKKPLYDLSILEDDLSDLFDPELTSRKCIPRKRRKTVMSKLSPIPKRRLTSAERFLRDNKEYYQFPETQDRLRRSLQSPPKSDENAKDVSSVNKQFPKSKNDPPANISALQHKTLMSLNKHPLPHKDNPSVNKPTAQQKNELTNKQDLEVKTELQVKKTHSQFKNELPTTNQDQQSKGRLDSLRDRKISSDSVKSSESIDDGTPIRESRGRRGSMDIDNIYFSFEGEPKSESWYQTYQRLMDGVPDNEYKYEEDALQFLLPYQMPKEYIKELYSRKFISRRKNALTDFVRKSPRCHASTLAFFSDLFPTKRKKGKPSPKKIPEVVSSDGASTPCSSSKPTTDAKEPPNNVLAISLYINQLISAETKSNIPNESGDLKPLNESKKSHGKKRSKGKKHDCPKDLSSLSKEFDNILTSEVDNKFLYELSNYSAEVNLYPDDILSKDPSDALSDSYHCNCTDDKPSDGLSICDTTDLSSECISLCSVDTVDNPISNSKSLHNKLLKATHKKRRKNMTGWPKQRRRRPAAAVPSDDNDSTTGNISRIQSKSELAWRKKAISRMESRLIIDGSKFDLEQRGRNHSRRRTSVFHNDAWPVRYRSCK